MKANLNKASGPGPKVTLREFQKKDVKLKVNPM
jgi:hypothetical protein